MKTFAYLNVDNTTGGMRGAFPPYEFYEFLDVIRSTSHRPPED